MPTFLLADSDFSILERQAGESVDEMHGDVPRIPADLAQLYFVNGIAYSGPTDFPTLRLRYGRNGQ